MEAGSFRAIGPSLSIGAVEVENGGGGHSSDRSESIDRKNEQSLKMMNGE